MTALQALPDAAGHVTWDVSAGSAIARAHQHAAAGSASSWSSSSPCSAAATARGRLVPASTVR